MSARNRSRSDVEGVAAARARVAAAMLVLAASAAAAGCHSRAPRKTAVIARDLDGVLLSAVIAADGTAYFAGGAIGGGASLLLAWDGKTARTIPTAGLKAFWWLHMDPAGRMFIGGEGGGVYAFDGAAVTPIDAGAPGDATIFGVWGQGPDDLWAVGGNVLTGGSHRVIQRNAGGAWHAVASPDGVDAAVTYFKVWGAAADDVWIVGQQSAVVHWDGSALVKVAAPNVDPYFTVYGCASNDVYAVGGSSRGALAHWDGAAWAPVALAAATPPLNGVTCAGGVATFAGWNVWVGRLHGASDTVARVETPADLGNLMIHGLFALPSGRVVAAGGDLTAGPADPHHGFALELGD